MQRAVIYFLQRIQILCKKTTTIINKDLLTGTVPVNKELLTGTVPVNNLIHFALFIIGEF